MSFKRVEAESGPFGPDGRGPEVGVDDKGGEEGEGSGGDTGGDEDVPEGHALGKEEEEGVRGQ